MGGYQQERNVVCSKSEREKSVLQYGDVWYNKEKNDLVASPPVL